MNHASWPLAFSYVRSQGPRGITREGLAQLSPGLFGRESQTSAQCRVGCSFVST